MKSNLVTAMLLAIGAAVSFALAGCSGATSTGSSGPLESGTAFLLSEEPEHATGVMDCRSLLEAEQESQDVVLVARIGGLSQPTWDPERAVFMVADLTFEKPESHDSETPEGHDADNCPFCRAKKKKELAAMAMVELVGGDGQVPNVSAQKLLGLSEGQTVVIQGTAELDKLDTLLVRAHGVYVRDGDGE